MTKASAFQGIQPTPNAVHVTNISPFASEKAVKDFFAFCGKINRFEMVKAGETEEAFILFDKVAAANTARLLTNATIGDRPVTISPFFDEHEGQDPAAAVEDEERKAAAQPLSNPEYRRYTSIVAGLLASGYVLSEPVVRKGLEMDARFWLSKTFSDYLLTAHDLAERYNVTQTLKEIDQKFQLTANANALLAKSMAIGAQALATPTGQRVKEMVDLSKEKALEVATEVATETRQIVHEKKAAARSIAASSSSSPVPANDDVTAGSPTTTNGDAVGAAATLTNGSTPLAAAETTAAFPLSSPPTVMGTAQTV